MSAPLPTELSIQVDGYPLTATLKRSDRPWGHAIDVHLIDADGCVRGSIVFGCHPEFREFAKFQAMSTEALMDIVRQRLPAAVAGGGAALDRGITLLFRFNAPDDSWDPEVARGIE
ncbi:hypothetical protein ACS5PN_29880 [Roseateles sp. NT4]|uniref:hypothetical protein n=1 Tax=Roseateles sp. NT4 TaxID=3453715 RepID=UPI003EEABB61